MIALAHRRCGTQECSFARSLVALLAALVVFAVVVDLGQVMLWANRATRHWSDTAGLEEAGEIVVMTLLVVFVAHSAAAVEPKRISARSPRAA